VSKSAQRFFLCRLIPPRADFAATMSVEERAMMQAHAGYWAAEMAEGNVLLFGPVADPSGDWGVGIVRAPDEAAVHRMEAGDPAVRSGFGFRYEVLPMPVIVTPDGRHGALS
jgi:uncharacterized protein YciI